MPTDVRKVEGYLEMSEAVLAETSIIRTVSNKNVLGSIAQGTQIKVYVNELATIADYVPGTGVAQSNDGSAYVTLNNFQEKGINEILDGYSVETAPTDHVVQRFTAAMGAAGEQIDTDGFGKMAVDGTYVGNIVFGAVEAATNMANGEEFQIVTKGTTNYTLVGAPNNDLGTIFTASAAGTGTGTVREMTTNGTKPVDSTIYAAILALRKALNEAKAPQTGRALIVSPEMEALMLDVDSKVFLNGNRADSIQASGFIGMFLGFAVFVSNLLPEGTNMIALQENGFAHKDEFIKEVAIISLDGSTNFYGDSAVKGRWAYNNGAVRPTLIQINSGTA